MVNNYRKNGSPESSTWKTNQDYFRGYTRAKLEEMHEDLKEIAKKTEKNTHEINNMKIKSALFGGIAGAVGGFLRGIF